MLFETIDPTLVKLKLDLVDLSLTALRDALRGAGGRTLTDLYDQLSRAIGTSDSAPPPGGVVMLGFDGSALRRVRVAPDGKLLAVFG